MEKSGGRVQYIRIEQNGIIHIQSLEVFDENGKNVALTSNGCKATQSALAWDGKADNPLRGVKDPKEKWPNSNHTTNIENSWWQVDLGKPVMVTKSSGLESPRLLSRTSQWSKFDTEEHRTKNIN
eukprot:UN32513